MSASREKRKRQEERLNAVKDGKKVRSKERSGKLRKGLAITVACLLVLAIAALAVYGTGIPHRSLTALTIDGVDISVAEYNFNYFTTLNSYVNYYGSMLGWDETTDFEKEESPFSTDQTVAEFCHENVLTTLKNAVSHSEKAKSEGLKISDVDMRSLEAAVQSYSDVAASSGKSLSSFLAANYGYGVNADVIRTAIERTYYAMTWEDHVKAGYTDDEVTAHYDANKGDFDWVTYHTFTFSGAYDGDEEGDELTQAQDAAKAEAKEKAEEMLAKLSDAATFKDVAAEFEEVEEDEDTDGTDGDTGEEEVDTTLKENVFAANLNDAMKTYLFDDSRKAGDKSVIESGTNYSVVMFVDRGREESPMFSIRHILVKSADDPAEATDEQIAEARTKAEEYLATWVSGNQSETYFSQLASEHSQDTSTASNGGLMDGISSTTFGDEFNNWCLDESRIPGDIAVLDSEQGSHVVYFIENYGQGWQYDVRSALYSEASNALVESAEVTEHDFALSFARTSK